MTINFRVYFRFIVLSVFYFASIFLYADNVENGEKIYKQNCTACHLMTKARLVGPGLEGVTEKYEKEWLIKWIRNSQALIASGDERAIAIFEEYDKSVMTSFDFSDEEFSDLLAYLANPPVEEVVVSSGVQTVENQGMSNSTILMIIALVLVTVVFLLVSVKNSLKTALGKETETVSQTLINKYKLFVSNNINVLFISAVGLIVGLKFVYDLLMGVGVTTNYQPAQPIAFSHEIHAGINGVDCNYCHTSARHSKHSGIPSANVCMNCHTYISEGSKYGTKEIAKIYEAVGFDPDSRQYIEGYEQKPIEWVRIHNLPDHAYFNHSQHVVAGGLECQECHGPVEEMEVLYQYSELTMGWCIECHRETEVKMEGNNYYTHLHDQLKEKYKGKPITVDMIGGIECGKCHY
ncbi:MAG: cytochrome C [Flavobacteriales bacterium]|nr:cytochrome C [Flavobacteriales bacterium]|tara:strand:+ start:972 stop:2189 length:1218 start_codon:yes stop_codon:yes gene_type:complete